MENFKNYDFWKQRRQFVKIAIEIYKLLHRRGQTICKKNVSYQILEQTNGYEHYCDEIVNSLYLDKSLIYYRDSCLSNFPDETCARMDAGIAYDDKFMRAGALRIGKLVVKIHKYNKLCHELGIKPISDEAFGSNFSY